MKIRKCTTCNRIYFCDHNSHADKSNLCYFCGYGGNIIYNKKTGMIELTKHGKKMFKELLK